MSLKIYVFCSLENVRVVSLASAYVTIFYLTRIESLKQTTRSSPSQFATEARVGGIDTPITRRILGHFSICLWKDNLTGQRDACSSSSDACIAGAVSSSLVTTRLNASRSISPPWFLLDDELPGLQRILINFYGVQRIPLSQRRSANIFSFIVVGKYRRMSPEYFYTKS